MSIIRSGSRTDSKRPRYKSGRQVPRVGIKLQRVANLGVDRRKYQLLLETIDVRTDKVHGLSVLPARGRVVVMREQEERNVPRSHIARCVVVLCCVVRLGAAIRFILLLAV